MADLLELAQRCSLDTWSQGKTVRLEADLDLAGTAFTPIPTFGGTFDGQGHTISGLSLTGSGSKQGLFRTIQSGGVVENLTVSRYGGTQRESDQRGRHRRCQRRYHPGLQLQRLRVRQDRSGRGLPAATRKAARSQTAPSTESSRGELYRRRDRAESGCTAQVQQQRQREYQRRGGSSVPSVEDLADLDLESTLTGTDSDEAESLLDSCTDTGGIAGYSSGVIQSCTNSGTVGYPHVGYNVGGIAGRQTGYLAGCVNKGSVLGRKDVGGIVGQAEPDLAVNPGSDTLERLRAGAGYTGWADPAGH